MSHILSLLHDTLMMYHQLQHHNKILITIKCEFVVQLIQGKSEHLDFTSPKAFFQSNTVKREILIPRVNLVVSTLFLSKCFMK